MAFREVFTALQQGTVDGQENPLSVITSAKFDQVQKHLTLTGHVYSPCVFLMNKGAFDKLSAADKTAFLEAAKEGVKANRARVDEDEAKGVADLRAKGMTVIDKVDKARFREGAGAGQCRLREAVRQGQPGHDPQLQVTARARRPDWTRAGARRGRAFSVEDSNMKAAFLRIRAG